MCAALKGTCRLQAVVFRMGFRNQWVLVYNSRKLMVKMLKVKSILEVTHHFEVGVVNIRIIVQFKFHNFFVLLTAILKHGKQYVCAFGGSIKSW